MNCGLSESQLREIKTVLSPFTNVESAILFGSRAKGNFRPASDVDIALLGDAITLQEQIQISARLNENKSLLKFDVLRFSTITNEKLRVEIREKGIVIYRATPL